MCSFIFVTSGSVMDFCGVVRITDVTYRVIRGIILTFGGSSVNVMCIISRMSNSICHGLLLLGDNAKYVNEWKNECFFLDYQTQ